MSAPVTPRYHRITFDLDRDAGWFMRTPELVPFPKVPDRLKVERTYMDRFRDQGADHMITGPMRAKRRTFYTGLRPLPVDGCFSGDDVEFVNGKRIRSLVLFQFNAAKDHLTVFYFPRYYRDGLADRTRFAVDFLTSQERQRAA